MPVCSSGRHYNASWSIYRLLLMLRAKFRGQIDELQLGRQDSIWHTFLCLTCKSFSIVSPLLCNKLPSLWINTIEYSHNSLFRMFIIWYPTKGVRQITETRSVYVLYNIFLGHSGYSVWANPYIFVVIVLTLLKLVFPIKLYKFRMRFGLCKTW